MRRTAGKTKGRSTAGRDRCGATMVESALIAMILIVVLFFFIDLCRYLYTYVVLNYAAYNGLEMAKSLEVGTDISDCSGTAPTVCDLYLQRLQRIADEALDKAYLAAAPSGSSAMTKLVSMTHFDPAYYPITGLSSRQLDAGFLRPGEVLVRSGGGLLHHSTRAYGSNAGEGWPKDGESWASVLEVHPLELLFEAELKTITPGIGPLRVLVRQRNFKRGISSGVQLPTN